MSKRLEKKFSSPLFDVDSCEEKHIFPNIELREMATGTNYDKKDLVEHKSKCNKTATNKKRNHYSSQSFSLGFNHFSTFRIETFNYSLLGTNYKLR